ncbi:MarR family winged helix-turn-helix transcriptional regulator [Microbacterium sp. SORGH_AS_0888]|uniref:MarR family winged helix-turn-helix transcriptional regulator n=1 Tax=Microbacterium sp. SORGH_AS_0888 TaxID=3041791 RepID=UPI002788737D|nr:MarR family transcriptional regulator [Microbacterium sp. SORGH_AS_0888]MDQ1128667.1 DNA-binding MarR family transcriptional regulator [Microbacterium sp. SORGH_AS_0888]
MTDQQLSPADALAQLAFLVTAKIEERSAANGLSVIQGRMLGILRDRVPLMSELGARLGLDKSSVSGLVDRAAKRGLVERVPSTEDRRAVHVRLTPEGRAMAAAGADGFEADVTGLLAPLSDDQQRALVALVAQLLEAHAEAEGFDIR